MIPFLRQVAEHYYMSGGEGLSSLCFIFPNRRSLSFFRRWLAEAVRKDPASHPVVAPEMLTMNDFFYRISGASVTGRVTLLLELYDCYKALNPKAESLDDFIFWGDVILGDFDDTDKYLAKPDALYRNVAEFKEIQDTYSYLTEAQEMAIRQFIGHFRRDGELTVNLDGDKKNVKERFLMIWNLMYPLYEKFRKALSDKNMAYEGMVYRSFADRLETESAVDILGESMPGKKKFVFVGLNALNECEKLVLSKMRDAGIAEFCWDYSSPMLRDEKNCASKFMCRNVEMFPQAFTPDEGCDMTAGPSIHLVSISSSVGQAKQLPEIFKSIAEAESGGDMSCIGSLDVPGADTAVVLPDETMLIPVLNTIPDGISSVNVTMGYPMSGSEIYGLMNGISALQLHIRRKKDGWTFYHKPVWEVLESGIIAALMDDETREKVAMVKSDAKLYVPQSDLSGTWLLDLIFRPVVTDAKEADSRQVTCLAEYQLDVLGKIGAKIAAMPGMALEVSFAKEYYLAVNRLKSMSLAILPVTYVRLLQQLVGGVSVPFENVGVMDGGTGGRRRRKKDGEGLQIMGPLETRALDFTNLIVLSCNEGIFPRRSVSSSFIPPELRKGFGLPTYENQDAVWAYYFFRMIQRCKNVWLLYDSRTEGLKSGEESRYIKQLEYQYKYKDIDRKVVRYAIGAEANEDVIAKTDEDVARIKSMTYSVSSIKPYLSCPAQFYYSSIKQLKKEDDVTESLDDSMIGNVYHNTMQALYLGGDALSPEFDMSRDNVAAAIKSGRLVPLEKITKSYLRGLLDEHGGIVKEKIRALIKSELRTDEVAGKNLILESLLNAYVRTTLEKDIALMGDGDSFTILGLEKKCMWELDGYKFTGYIDRLDSFGGDLVRVVDYKTGKIKDEEMKSFALDSGKVDEEAQERAVNACVEKLFSPDTKSKSRPGILLQLFLYDKFLEKELGGKRMKNVVYPLQTMAKSGILESMKNGRFNELAEGRLRDVLAELGNPAVGFRRTDDKDTCKYCDFRKICGK